MEIRRLEREIYARRAFTARYRSNGYYDIGVSEDGFPIRYLPFAAPEERSFEDVFFSAWLEDPVAFGAFEGGELLGFAEGSPEGWNRRFRISNICVFDPSRRGGGIGQRLLDAIQSAPETAGARMLVPETQSRNEAAIAFYRKTASPSSALTSTPTPIPTRSGTRSGSKWGRSSRPKRRKQRHRRSARRPTTPWRGCASACASVQPSGPCWGTAPASGSPWARWRASSSECVFTGTRRTPPNEAGANIGGDHGKLSLKAKIQ